MELMDESGELVGRIVVLQPGLTRRMAGKLWSLAEQAGGTWRLAELVPASTPEPAPIKMG